MPLMREPLEEFSPEAGLDDGLPPGPPQGPERWRRVEYWLRRATLLGVLAGLLLVLLLSSGSGPPPPPAVLLPGPQRAVGPLPTRPALPPDFQPTPATAPSWAVVVAIDLRGEQAQVVIQGRRVGGLSAGEAPGGWRLTWSEPVTGMVTVPEQAGQGTPPAGGAE